MTIQSKQELSQAASRLHKLLKQNATTQAWSHNKALELLAQALGFKSAAVLQAQLPDAPHKTHQKKRNSLRLSNEGGWLDLVPAGELGKVAHGQTFEVAQGTVEDILSCVAYAEEGCRTGSRIDFDYLGETDIAWDCQTTRRTEDGWVLWDFEGEILPENLCLLIPSAFRKLEDEGKLPVREPLVEHYARAAKQLGLLASLAEDEKSQEAYLQLQEQIGFALHAQEQERLMERLLNR